MNTSAAITLSQRPSDAGMQRVESRRWSDRLFEPIPISPIVYFRILFGAIMVWEIGRYIAYGWIRSHYLTGRFAFKYYGFEWVQAWTGPWLYVHFAVVGLAAAAIALGAAYRISTAVFFLGFTYIYLLDQIYYLNHLYLVCLLAFIAMFLPAHRALSVDARLWPAIHATHVPAWTLHLLRFQIAVVYVFGGIAKLSADWLRGEPVRAWLGSRADWPVLGPVLANEAAVWLICYGGLLLDLLIVPLLLWRRTRWLAVAALVVFHIFNSVLFRIGIFPWLMLALIPLFLPLAWWSRLNQSLALFEYARRPEMPPSEPTVSEPPRPTLTVTYDPPRSVLAAAPPVQPLTMPRRRRRQLVTALLCTYALVQVLVPFRHFLYPGSVHWSEEGHRFSWHMKLRAKRTHVAEFWAFDPDRRLEWRVPSEPYLPPAALRRAATRPDMVLQLARQMAQDLRERGHPNVEIRARILVGLNDHPVQNLVDPNVDLGREDRSLRPAHWIMPLRTNVGPPSPVGPPAAPDDQEL